MDSPTGPPHQDAPPAPVVAVTGAAGWLGQNLVRALAASRARVRCLVHVADEAPLLEVIGRNVEVEVGDVRDPTALDRLFDGLEAPSVFHTAAVIHPQRSTREFFDVNVGGTSIVLDRARRAGAGRFLHVSSNSPFGANATPDDRFDENSPFNPYLGYGQSKLAAEELVQRTNDRGDVPTVILRAPWFYGPYQPVRQTRFFATVRRGRFPLVGDGSQRRSMVYTDHLVHGLLRAEVAGPAPGRAYWIADPEPYALADILSTVKRALEAEGMSTSSRSLRIPLPAARLAAGIDAVLQDRGRYAQALHVLGELKDTIACDVSRARAELGYAPTTSLLDGMRASVRWCQAQGHAL